MDAGPPRPEALLRNSRQPSVSRPDPALADPALDRRLRRRTECRLRFAAVGYSDDLPGCGAVEIVGQLRLELADTNFDHMVTLARLCDYFVSGSLSLSITQSMPYEGSISYASRSERASSSSRHAAEQPMYVVLKSISVATHQARSSGHQMFADCPSQSSARLSSAPSIAPFSSTYSRPGVANVGAYRSSTRNAPTPCQTANQQRSVVVVCPDSTSSSGGISDRASEPSLGGGCVPDPGLRIHFGQPLVVDASEG